MLVVTRRKGQRIVIGSDIEVIVTGISGSTVRLAVVAPRSVQVLRGEVHDEVRHENQAASGTPLDLPLGELGQLAHSRGVSVMVPSLRVNTDEGTHAPEETTTCEPNT